MGEGSAVSVIDHLNSNYLQLGLVALVFGGLQVWWISTTLRKRDLARPLSEGEFRKTLERIWAKEQRDIANFFSLMSRMNSVISIKKQKR